MMDRKTAVSLGLPRYFPGTECKRGHIAERFTASKTCVSCDAEKRAKIPGRSTAWARANPDRVAAQRKDWNARNPGRMTELGKRWRERNPDARRQWNAKRRTGGLFSRHDIRDKLKSQGGLCAAPWCRVALGSAYHADHILPVKLGGETERRNLQLLCPDCNLRKGAKRPADFWAENGHIWTVE